MALLVTGLCLFVVLHLIPVFPQYRFALQSLLGDGPYKGLFSLLALVSMVLIVMGLKNAPFVPLYDPPVWGRSVTLVLMLPALYLFFSTGMGPAPSSAKVITAHPMSWGVVVWAGAHLLANGDVAHVLFFLAIGVYSLVSIFSGRRRGLKPALSARPDVKSELLFVAIVIAVYLLLFVLHPYFTGMPLTGSQVSA